MVQFNCHDLKIALIFLQFAYWRGVALHAWPAPADPTLTAHEDWIKKLFVTTE
jgi:hypothetical protein